MFTISKKIPRITFGLIIICFFFPFMDISCGGQKFISLSGVQLITGTTIKEPDILNDQMNADNQQFFKGNNIHIPGNDIPKVHNIPPEPLAIVTFSFIALGLILSFNKKNRHALFPAICSSASLITLLLLKNKIDNDVLREGSGAFMITYATGFWTILVLLIITISMNFYIFSVKEEEKKKGKYKASVDDINLNLNVKTDKTDINQVSNTGIIEKNKKDDDTRWMHPDMRK